jgi:hypothetical protein
MVRYLSLNCSISDGSGDKIQRDVINTSGNVQLSWEISSVPSK